VLDLRPLQAFDSFFLGEIGDESGSRRKHQDTRKGLNTRLDTISDRTRHF
jgi:hypothetical protein